MTDRAKVGKVRDGAWKEVEKLREAAALVIEASAAPGAQLEAALFEWCAANGHNFRRVHRALLQAACIEIVYQQIEQEELEEEWGSP